MQKDYQSFRSGCIRTVVSKAKHIKTIKGQNQVKGYFQVYAFDKQQCDAILYLFKLYPDLGISQLIWFINVSVSHSLYADDGGVFCPGVGLLLSLPLSLLLPLSQLLFVFILL